jgi:small subunit ribosomal protein S2
MEDLLVPNDEYLKAGIHIGTKFKTNYMSKFIYKTRPDGLNILNIEQIDKRLRLLANFLANYDPEDILVVSRRENGWKPVNEFSELTGVKTLTGRYPPGILSNQNLDSFMEAEVMLVTDAWPDRNAIKDGLDQGIVTVALSDTNNESNNIDFVVPCNNKGRKSLALVFLILAREFLKEKGQIDEDDEFPFEVEDFMQE